MIQLNSNEAAVIKALVTRYGEDITLKELLKQSYKQPIEKVTFELRGVYDNAYELTGDEFDMQGKISDYFAFEFGKNLTSSENGVLLTSILSDSELNELADYFLGKREETCRNYTKAVQSREVTHDELVEYLKTLYVNKSFKYRDTMVEF